MPSGWSWGDGSKATNPAPYTFTIVKGWLRSTTLPDFTLYFYSGDYPVFDASNPGSAEHQFRISGDTNRVVRLLGIPASNGTLPRLILRPEPTNSNLMTTYVSSWPPSATFQHVLIGTATDPNPNVRAIYRDNNGVYRDYLNRIEVENLEFDGNFAGHAPLSTAANPTGYKSAALELWARTGRIKNVKVRNFGSLGQVPYSLVEGNNSGVEAFPVSFTTFDDVKGSTPDPVPWLVENVEVSDFHSVHGGYGTMILGSVNTTNSNTSAQAPVALFRGCTVNGGLGTIAYGAAGHPYAVFSDPNPAQWTNPAAYTSRGYYSALSRHEANIALNGGAVFNTDTGSVHGFRLRNGIYLDVLNLGHLGTANQTVPSHVNYEFNTNLIRLRGRQLIPSYSEFYINSLSDWGTDPNRALGRNLTNFADGIVIQGVAADITFAGNLVTTWPAAGFLTTNPATTNESVFRLIWPIAPDTWFSDAYFSRFRNPAQNVVLSDNAYSVNAFEFGGANSLPNYTLSYLYPTYAAPYTASRLALTQLPAGFNPQGKVERIMPQWVGTNLTAAWEVAFGPTYVTNGNQLLVTVRAVEHRTSASGTRGTVALTGSNVWVAAELNTVAGGSNLLGMVSLSIPANGVATQTLSLGTNVSAWVQLKAWLPAGGVTNFEAGTRAWASHDVSMGSVVQVGAVPDVADDRNSSTAKRAILRFTRTGTPAALSNTLSVSFLLPTNGVPELVSPVDYRNLLGTYGTTGSADYFFAAATGGSVSTVVPGGTNTVTFNANSTEVQVPVVTRTDSLTEANVLRVEVIPTTSYALGRNLRTDVLVYDGPFWTLVELTASQTWPTAFTTFTGLNNGVTDSSGAFTVNPRIVGTGTYFDTVYNTYFTSGGAWKYPQVYLSSLSSTLVPQAVSFRGTSSEAAWVAGYAGDLARVGLDDGTSWITLPHLSTGASKALAMSSNGTNIAGSSQVSGVDRAVAWFQRGSAQDLASVAADGPGVAYGINTNGVVVGQASLKFGGVSYANRPFRTTGGTAGIIDSGDVLPTPSGNGEGAASAINATGTVVGWYAPDPFVPNTFAIAWAPRIPSQPNTVGTSLGAWFPPWQSPQSGNFHSLSRALSLSDKGSIVGWSGTSTAGARAMYRPFLAANWQDLNDRHFSSFPSGWILQQAVMVNDQGFVIGNGTFNGSARGFVLVPRIPGQ